MVLLWRLMTGQKLPRVSGLEYLELLLKQPEMREPGAVLWVMPNAAARERNWLGCGNKGAPRLKLTVISRPIIRPAR